MESIKKNTFSINIPNYTGPLEVLLDLAKSQKVDLNEISITKLADQFLEYVKNNENLNLETASEFLLKKKKIRKRHFYAWDERRY